MKPLIPNAALEQHIIVLGKTGAGKSSAIRSGFVEPLLDHEEPVCILDPKGDWWGLKSSADGRRAGYSIVIFGGQHADVPINEHSGPHVAELFATGNRSMIIDVSDFTVGERTRFFLHFAATLYRKNRGKRWVVIDECHNFAPQGKVLDVDSGKALHWANKLASEGRGKGLNIIGASQRPQKVHKDFITSMETLVAMRVIHNLDRDAIKAWIDGCADKTLGRQVLDELASMERGEAWVWSPEIKFGPERVKFPLFKTYDSFKPQDGDTGKLAGWADVNLDEVRSKMAGMLEEAKANDPQALKAQIRDLQQKLSDLSHAAKTIGDVDSARLVGYKEGWNDAIAANKTQIYEYATNISDDLRKAATAINALATQAQMAPIPIPSPAVLPERKPPIKVTNPLVRPAEMAKHLQSMARTEMSRQYSDTPASPTVRKILDVIHKSFPVSLSFDAAARRAGVSKQSSAYRKYRKELEQSPEIVLDGNRYRSADGFSKGGGFDSVQSVEQWAASLPPSYGEMLKVIAKIPGVDKQTIAITAGISPTSSGLGAGLNELQRLELIEKHGDGYRVTEGLR